MNKYILILSLILILVMTACGGSAAAVTGSVEAAAGANTPARLHENYIDALPVQSQLAIGTLQLENGENAVDETLAAELLPLWRAVQSLASSETSAQAEITAVLNQIQDTMTPAQIAAVANMQITQDSFQAMLEEGLITMGRGALGGGQGQNNDGSSSLAPGAAMPGSGPGGGIPGSGPGGGLGGGLAGSPGGDPGAMQTRLAESGVDPADFQTLAMTGAVIRLLENKTEAVPEGNFGMGGMFGQVITAVSESTHLSQEEVQTALDEGKTFSQIIEENGGDLEAVKAALTESLADSEFLQGQDPNEFITNFLNSGGFSPPSGNE
jgi:hypothetical protein